MNFALTKKKLASNVMEYAYRIEKIWAIQSGFNYEELTLT